MNHDKTRVKYTYLRKSLQIYYSTMKPTLFPISFGEYFGGDLFSFEVIEFICALIVYDNVSYFPAFLEVQEEQG